jgi:hypothetical protein
MNAIQSIYNQQSGQVTQNSALRKAAGSTRLPQLTKDESSLIKENFTPAKKMNLYSMDGKMKQEGLSRGAKIDTRA